MLFSDVCCHNCAVTEKLTRQPLIRELHHLLLWVMLPLVMLIGALGYLDYAQASRSAEGFVQRRAATLASDVSEFLAATERGLTLMAKRPGVLLMDPLRCDPGLGDLIALQPRYANLMVIDPRGALICGASMPASGLPPVNLSDGEGFRAVMAGQSFVLGPVRRGSIVGRWVLSALVPVRGVDGSVSGVLAVVIDLTRWPLNAPASDPLADTVQGVIDRTGTILLRSPDAEKWVGRNSGNSQITADMLRVGEGTFVSKGVQGFDRFWAVQPIAGTPWISYVGVRADAVRAQPLRQAALSAGVIVAILLVALWLALKASRRLTAPIAHLAQVAVRAGAGDLSVRAEPAGPAEVAQVAQEVNRMLELRASAEANLRHQEQSLRITLNSIGDAVIATDAQGLVTRMNPTAEQLTGWPLADALGRPLAEVFRIVTAVTRLPAASPVQRVMDSGEVIGLADHTALLARDGREYQIADSAAPIRDAAGDIQGVVLVFSDVSERYRAEAALRVSEHALQSVSQGVVISGSDQLIISANTSFATITGYSEAQVLGRNCNFLKGPDTDPVTVAAIRTALHRPAEFSGEILNYRQDGTAFWNGLTISPLLDAQGALTHFIGIMRDITERKQAELALQASLSDKEALIKEVHHRVKNNLQVITSLLRLESGRSDSASVKSVLSDMQGRVRSMATLHESLYRSGTFASVDLGSYLKQLATLAFQTQSTNEGAVRLQLNLRTVPVSMDQATSCGLLVNELISNCFKHGFPSGVTGHVSIDLQPLDTAHQWCLRVSDTGVGLPENFEERRKNSLGLQLAVDLARQVGGVLTITPNQHNGVSFSVNFQALELSPPLVMPA